VISVRLHAQGDENGIVQRRRLDWFGQVRDHAELAAALGIPELPGWGQHHQHRLSGFSAPLDLLHQREAVEGRHLRVGQHELEGLVVGCRHEAFQGCRGAFRQRRSHAPALNQVPHEAAVGIVVVDDKHRQTLNGGAVGPEGLLAASASRQTSYLQASTRPDPL